MSSFIIINAAMNNAKRRREEEDQEEEDRKEKKKAEEELIAKGYKKEYVLKNKNTRYCHEYRSISKQNKGILIMTLSFIVFCSIISCFFILDNMNVFCIIPFILSFGFFLYGGSRYSNLDYVWSPVKEANSREGFYLVKTKDEAKYEYEWIKKDKK